MPKFIHEEAIALSENDKLIFKEYFGELNLGKYGPTKNDCRDNRRSCKILQEKIEKLGAVQAGFGFLIQQLDAALQSLQFQTSPIDKAAAIEWLNQLDLSEFYVDWYYLTQPSQIIEKVQQERANLLNRLLLVEQKLYCSLQLLHSEHLQQAIPTDLEMMENKNLVTFFLSDNLEKEEKISDIRNDDRLSGIECELWSRDPEAVLRLNNDVILQYDQDVSETLNENTTPSFLHRKKTNSLKFFENKKQNYDELPARDSRVHFWVTLTADEAPQIQFTVLDEPETQEVKVSQEPSIFLEPPVSEAAPPSKTDEDALVEIAKAIPCYTVEKYMSCAEFLTKEREFTKHVRNYLQELKQYTSATPEDEQVFQIFLEVIQVLVSLNSFIQYPKRQIERMKENNQLNNIFDPEEYIANNKQLVINLIEQIHGFNPTQYDRKSELAYNACQALLTGLRVIEESKTVKVSNVFSLAGLTARSASALKDVGRSAATTGFFGEESQKCSQIAVEADEAKKEILTLFTDAISVNCCQQSCRL